MSTRAQIKVKDEHGSILFYRHSDGYPEGTLPTLKEFMELVVNKKIRDNVSQASGWLVEIGRREYGNSIDAVNGWKIGAYEPDCDIHNDIQYFYILNLNDKTITVQECKYGENLSGEENKFKTIKILTPHVTNNKCKWVIKSVR